MACANFFLGPCATDRKSRKDLYPLIGNLAILPEDLRYIFACANRQRGQKLYAPELSIRNHKKYLF